MPRDLAVEALGAKPPRLRIIDPRAELAQQCLASYYGELANRLPQGFEVSRSRDPEAADLIAPRGGFWVAVGDDSPVGCVGLKGSGGEVAEIKRLWVSPAARRLGLARRLMAAAEGYAQEIGVALLRLDTNGALPEASALYRRTGWVEIDRFNDDPYAEVFFEKRLPPRR